MLRASAITESDFAQLGAYIRSCRHLYKTIEHCAVVHENCSGNDDGDQQWTQARQQLAEHVQETSFEAPRGVTAAHLAKGVQDVLNIYTYVNTLRECRSTCAERDSIPILDATLPPESKADAAKAPQQFTPAAMLDEVYADMCRHAEASCLKMQAETAKLVADSRGDG